MTMIPNSTILPLPGGHLRLSRPRQPFLGPREIRRLRVVGEVRPAHPLHEGPQGTLHSAPGGSLGIAHGEKERKVGVEMNVTAAKLHLLNCSQAEMEEVLAQDAGRPPCMGEQEEEGTGPTDTGKVRPQNTVFPH